MSEQTTPGGQQQGGQPGEADDRLSEQLREKVREANARSEVNRLSKGGQPW